MLTRKQHELIRFIQTRLEESGVSPSFEEMKEALDLKSKSGVHRLISALEERGFIRRRAHRARAIEIVKLPEAMEKPGFTPQAFEPKVIQGELSDAVDAEALCWEVGEIVELRGRVASTQLARPLNLATAEPVSAEIG